MKIIDPHIHLFDRQAGEYNWLKQENPPFWPDKKVIERDFSEQDLKVNSPLVLFGFVHIEAGFNNEKPWQEIEWLESTCTLPFRSIACTDLTADPTGFRKNIDQLLAYSSIAGVRHILDEEALNVLNHPNTLMNLKYLEESELIFELQMPFSDADATDCFVETLHELSKLKVIINHSGFPPYTLSTASLDWRFWLDNLAKISSYQNVALKCSGSEMIKRDYELDWVNNTLKAVVELFGIERVMLASNFPLCLFSKSYHKLWWENFEISEIAANNLLFNNAHRWYKFDEANSTDLCQSA